MPILIVKTGTWPEPSAILGTAEDWSTAALAREFVDETGCQPDLPGYVSVGGAE